MSEAHRPPFPEDVLLEHRVWVRVLARSLVRDSAEAEDLEQDTWVRALESMPRDARSPRAWLGTVLRNRLRDRVRTRERRAGREQAVARDGAHPAAADIAASAEIHRTVLDAVLALEPPFRDVVLLRYFEGLTPAEIAERQGVPATTVRTRLHRGLGRLRERLDAEHGGDGERWRHALAPLLLPAALPARPAPPRKPFRVPVAPTVVVAIIASGVLLVPLLLRGGTQRRAMATAAAVPAAAPAVHDAAGADTTTPRERRHVGEPPDDGADGTADGAAASGAEELAPAPVAQDGRRVRVAVVDAAGQPVAGARVQLLDGNGFAKSGFARVLAEAATDAAGAADFASPGAEELRLVARTADRAAVGPVLDRDAALGAAQRLQLGAAAVLRGTLVTPEGAGIPGARVALMLTGDVFGPGGSVASDEQGRFAFAPLPQDAFATPANVEIVADGFPRTDHPATRADATGAGLRIVLTPAVTLTGRCVDADGRPVEAVWVSCSHAVEPDETAASGTFAVRGVDVSGESGRPVSVSFECPTHAPRRIELTDSMLASGGLGDVVLATGAAIRGVVLGPDGEPVPHASVYAEGTETRQIARQGQTDEAGRFVFEHCGDEPHEIVASGPADDAFSGLTGTVSGVRPAGEEVVVRISAAMTVLVELLDAETGEPLRLTNALVLIEPLDGDESDEAGNGVSSDDGFCTVRVRAKRPGAYRLTVRSFDGWGECVVDRIVVPEDRELRVRAVLRKE